MDVLRTFDGRAKGLNAELLIRIRAFGVVDARHDMRDLEDVLGDLRSHDVAVVALSHGDETVGMLDARTTENIGVGAVADHLLAAKLPGQDATRRGTREGIGVAIDDDHLVALTVHVGRNLRADPATPYDQQPQRALIIESDVSRPLGGTPGLLPFGRLRFPFTFMGVMALGIGLWVVAYLAIHRSLDAGSQGLAAGTAVVCFGFAAYVLIRRLVRGPQH